MKESFVNMMKVVLFILVIISLNSTKAQILTAQDTADFNSWTYIDADGDSFNWAVVDLTGVGTIFDDQGGCVISSSWSPSAGILYPDNYFISPAINLASNFGPLQLEFSVGSIEPTSSYWFGEWLSVYVVTDSSLSSICLATPIFSDSLPAGQTIFNYSLDISSMAGNQNVYVVFRHHNCNDENFIILDDISVTNPSIGITENNINIQLYPNPAIDILNIETNFIIQSISIIGINGRLISNEIVNSPIANIKINELTSGVYFCEIKKNDGAVIRRSFIRK